MAAHRRVRLNRTLGPLVVQWIESNLVHGPGDIQGDPLELDDEFARFLFDAYRLDDRGRRLVRRAILSRPKGRAKSEFAAAIACAEALGPVRFAGWDSQGRPLGRMVTSPYIPVAATEEGQAGNTYDGIWFMLTEGPVSRTPGLDVGLTRTFLPGGGKIAAITSKSASKDGGKETFCVFDETHLYVLPEHHRLHATIRRNMTKRKDAEPWALETSTMYAPGENSVAEASHEYAKQIRNGKIRDTDGFLFDHREGTDPEKFDWDDDSQLREAVAVAFGPAAEWADLDRIVDEARDPQTNRSDVIRYYLNRPAKHEEALFIPRSLWMELVDEDAALVEGEPVALGLDGSRTFDTTVVSTAQPTLVMVDGEEEDGLTISSRVFSVRADVAHHVLHIGGRIDFEDVEAYTVDQFNLYDVVDAAYDPRYLERSAELIDARLPAARIIAVEPQSKHMREALQTFERLCLERKIRHDGDPVVAAHIANTRVERGPRGEIRRIAKIDQRKPIDAVPAMALAAWRAMQGEEELVPLVALA